MQEAWAIQFLPRLPHEIRSNILNGAALFPWALNLVLQWRKAAITESAAARALELKTLGVKVMGGETTA